MAYIYAYEPDCYDCSTIGLVGALMDQDARFELRAGEFGELTFTHPIDPWGKWQVLQDGVILKTLVPVRLVPEVDDGTYVEYVDKYKVSQAATKYQRYIYYADTASKDPTREVTRNKRKYQKTKHKKLLKKGANVIVIADKHPNDPSYRYKVRVGSGKGKVVGYMEKAGLTVVQQHVAVAEDQTGLEAVDQSYSIQQQLFRIYEVETDSSPENAGSITVHARRLVYDLLGNVCTYKATANISCQTAATRILENTAFSHPFSVFSDIGDKHIGLDVRNLNPLAALIDPDAGLMAHWSGEVVCDDYDIYILRRAGMDRGVAIRYGKNLSGVSCHVDTSNVATAIRPVGETAAGNPLYLDIHQTTVSGVPRYGYNYSDGSCANLLPLGYRWAVDDDGVHHVSSIIERDLTWDGYAIPKAAVLEVPDAHVTKKTKGVDPSQTSVITAKEARVMLAQAAVAAFEGGCDQAEVSLEVDFTMLGDTEEYSQYKHLEPLFIYDTVHITHPRVAVKADINLTSITWMVREERVSASTFGSLGDAVASIPGWQISSLNGSRIVGGTINSGQLAQDAIATEHLQAESVNADIIQARSITADHLAAHAIDAQLIEAEQAVIDAIEAGTITTGSLASKYAELYELISTVINTDFANVDDLSAALANVVALTATSARFDVATVTTMIGKVIRATLLTSGLARIDNLYVTQANLLNATLDRLTILGADGNYYDVSVGTDGQLYTIERDPDTINLDSGTTDDGRNVLDGSDMEGEIGIDVPDLDGEYLTTMEDGLTWLTVQALSTGKLTATEAVIGTAQIPSLQTTTMEALGRSLNLLANDTIQLLLGTREDIRAWFEFTDDGLIVRKTGSDWNTATTENGFYIDNRNVPGHIGAFEHDLLTVRGLKIGDITARSSGPGGGWVLSD